MVTRWCLVAKIPLTNEEQRWLTFLLVPMVADYLAQSGQGGDGLLAQLATLLQQPAKSDATADQHQLQALRERAMTLLTTLAGGR